MDTRMSRSDTTWSRTVAAAALIALISGAALAQSGPMGADWRRIGSTSVHVNLSSTAGGPIERVWFDAGGLLHVRRPDGRVFATADFEKWARTAAEPPQVTENELIRSVRGVTYRAGENVLRSDNGGATWKNLTEFHGQSLLGGRVLDLAVDITSADRIAVASETGVWASIDGGRTWAGLNDGLPNLAVRRLLAAPRGSNGVRAAILTGGETAAFEWRGGEAGGWLPVADDTIAREEVFRLQAAERIQSAIAAAALSGGIGYAGGADGRLWASQDSGITWRVAAGGPVGLAERFWVDQANPRTALAVVRAGASEWRLLRTVNGGAWWDDLTANLGETRIYGVTAHVPTGAIYVAAARGVFWTLGDLRAPTPPTTWQQIAPAWPDGAVMDVRLDGPGHLLIAAVDGEGLYSMLAPHRLREPVLVDAADMVERAVAPGSLLSLLGGRAEQVAAQTQQGAVLAAQDSESQIQLPYGLSGERVQIEIAGRQGRLRFDRPLRAASPAIVVASDGNAMVLDAESGLQLDALNSARGGMRLQILMSGLGRVVPEWPAGLAAPLADPPRVAAPLRAYLDGAQIPVERATLAPGYIGYYLVEVRLPEFVAPGALELSVEAAGERSNRVRLLASE